MPSKELCRDLWRRFKRSAQAVAANKPDGCYIGVQDGPAVPTVVFRVERRVPQRYAAVALYVRPETDAETGRLVFSIRAVVIVNGKVSGRPATAVPVLYDARRDRFSVSTP